MEVAQTQNEKPLTKKVVIGLKVLTLLIFALFLTVNANWFSSDINEELKPHGLSVSEFDFRFTAPYELRLHQIDVNYPGVKGHIEEVFVKLEFWPLFQGNVIVEHIIVKTPNLELIPAQNQPIADTKDQTPESKSKEQKPLLSIANLVIKQIYIDDLTLSQQVNEPFEINPSDIEITNLELISNGQSNVSSLKPSIQFTNDGGKLGTIQWQHIYLNSQLDFSTMSFESPSQTLATSNHDLLLTGLTFNDMPLGDIEANVLTEPQQVLINKLTVKNSPTLFDLQAKMTLPVTESNIQITVVPSQVQFEQFAPLYTNASVKPFGLIKLSGDVATNGDLSNTSLLIENLTGNLKAKLQPGKLEGMNLNAAFAALKDSQETSLLEVGGYLLTGPLGLIAGQLFDLTGGISTLGGQTNIQHLSLITEFKNSNVEVTGSALATDEFRLALKGNINPIRQEFIDFQFALLNSEGCADLAQTLNGDMSDPTSAVANNLLASITSPINEITSGVSNAVAGCDVFYQGPVQHPVDP